jgi:hypothetical protein
MTKRRIGSGLTALAVAGVLASPLALAQALLSPKAPPPAPDQSRQAPSPRCEDDCKTVKNIPSAQPPSTKAPAMLGAAVKPAKPLNSQRANTGPGTQTEDDVYVGVKRQVQGVNTPGTVTPQVRPGAGTSPNTAAATGRKTARTGGDDDLDDLEVERRKVQGVNTPGTAMPLVRPGAGTSPNTGRSNAGAPGMPPLPR